MATTRLNLNDHIAPKTSRKPATRKPVALKHDELTTWSHRTVITTAIMSAGLNGFANWQTASPQGPAIGVLSTAIGLSIPWVIYSLCRVLGEQCARGHTKRARITAVAALALLALSVHHCAVSIALLVFGTPILNWECWAMSIAIDAGFVASELATIKVK